MATPRRLGGAAVARVADCRVPPISATPARLAGQEDQSQSDENQWPHGLPLDPGKEARVRREQQNAECHQDNAGGTRVTPVVAVPLGVALGLPPRFSLVHVLRPSPSFSGQTLGLTVKLLGPVVPHVRSNGR